jgi:peptidoglycan/xylan/chitin deacetylase (PgdA/CDA1 family)
MKLKRLCFRQNRNKIWQIQVIKISCLLLLFLFLSCKSINSGRIESGIPHSVVFFSFDDGPNAYGETTEQLLDVLKKYKIKALFFLLGENTEYSPDLVKRMYDEGHYVASHGYSDKWAYWMNDDEFKNNLVRAQEAISSALGQELFPKLYRPHGGFYRSRHENIFRGAGYTMIPVNVRIYDASMTRVDMAKAVKNIIKKTERQGGGIILLHDGRDSHFRVEAELAKNPAGVYNRSWIPELVEEIINALLSKGYDLNRNYFIEFIE